MKVGDLVKFANHPVYGQGEAFIDSRYFDEATQTWMFGVCMARRILHTQIPANKLGSPYVF